MRSSSTDSQHAPIPLSIPQGLADDLRKELDPRTTIELILVRQAIWAFAQLMTLIDNAPARPDAHWLRLFNTADRTFHRNLRELRRLRAARPAEKTTAATPRPSAGPTPPRPHVATTSASAPPVPSSPSRAPEKSATNTRPPVASAASLEQRILRALDQAPLVDLPDDQLPFSILPASAASQ